MISQQQNDIHMPEEETPPPLVQKQPFASTSWWRSWSLWLRILGVVLGVVVAVPGIFIIDAIGNLALSGAGPDLSSFGFLLLFILVGLVSAVLIRSWWSLLIVPVAFSVGFFLHPFFAIRNSDDNTTMITIIVLLAFLGLVEIGVAIGTPIGKSIKKQVLH